MRGFALRRRRARQCIVNLQVGAETWAVRRDRETDATNGKLGSWEVVVARDYQLRQAVFGGSPMGQICKKISKRLSI